MAKAIGIDLGTTNSVVAFVESNGSVTVIPNQEGKRTTPSVVAFKDNDILVGELAKRQMVVNPKKTIYSAKRFIGRSYDEVLEEKNRVPYEVKRDSSNRVLFDIEGKEYHPQQISAMVLQKLKKAAEDYLGEPVKDAVITVPAYFNDAQRKATKEAGEIAGLNVIRIINEPTAAAIAFGYDKGHSGKVVVFDLGGGTFDVSLLDIQDGVFEVLATSGDSHLGGDDFDNKIIDWLVEEFLRDEGVDLRKDSRAMARLKEAAEIAKIELSNNQSTEISLPYITVDPRKGPLHLNKTLTRAKFESLCEDLFNRLIEPCEKVLVSAGVKKSEISSVVLVGGSTRIPKVQEVCENFFGIKPNKGVNPDEAVAIGAAIHAHSLTADSKEKSILLLDVIPISLGVETYGDIFAKVVESNTTIPTRKSQIFTTFSDNQTTVEIHVLQGERPMASENKSLGRFYLDGIPPAPRGVPQIEVTFDIDANGILTVSAKELRTGKESSIRIEGASNLSKEEVERMKEEAKRYEKEDQEKLRRAEQINQADAVAYQAEKFLRENGEKLEEGLRSKISEMISRLRLHIHNKSYLEIEKTKEDLLRELQNAYQSMTSSENSTVHSDSFVS